MLSSDACLEISPQDDRESQSVVCEDQEYVHFDSMSLSREHTLAENDVRETCAARGSTTSSIDNPAPLDQEPVHVHRASSQRVEESSSLQQLTINGTETSEDSSTTTTRLENPKRILFELIQWSRKFLNLNVAEELQGLQANHFIRGDLPLSHPTHPGGVVYTFKASKHGKSVSCPVMLYRPDLVKQDDLVVEHPVQLFELYASKCPTRIKSKSLFLTPIEMEPEEGWALAGTWFKDVDLALEEIHKCMQ